MYQKLEVSFAAIVKGLALFTMVLLLLIVFFIFKESTALFADVSLWQFISGKSWQPIAQPPRLGILPMIMASLLISFIAIVLALPVGVGCALFLSNMASDKVRHSIRLVVDILAGIPSIVYGFIGLLVLVRFFEVRLDMASGESILCAAIVLAVMILPYIVATCDESMGKVARKFIPSSQALGVPKWYMIWHLVLPASKNSILASAVLATARALGETMAVMMVVGNTPVIPQSIWDKAQPIPALIALEMGSTAVGTTHYHALFSSGLILMAILMIVNGLFYFISKKTLN